MPINTVSTHPKKQGSTSSLKPLAASLLMLAIIPAFPSGAQAFTFGQFLRAIEGIHRSGMALCDGFSWECGRSNQSQANTSEPRETPLPDQAQMGAPPTATDGGFATTGQQYLQ